MGEESKARVNKTAPTRHCGLDPQSRGADRKRHAEYLLDTTVAQDRSAQAGIHSQNPTWQIENLGILSLLP